MKSILFVIPWTWGLVGNADYDFADAPERAPENVVSLATYLKSQGARVAIADLTRELALCRGNVEECLSHLGEQCRLFNPDVIGLSFFTAHFEYAARIVGYLHSLYAGAECRPMIIAGGVHPTLLPKVTYEYIDFDALMVGEGEISLMQLLDGRPLHEIKGVFLPGQDKPEQADVLDDLDRLPFPDWNLVDKDFYSQPSHQISATQLHSVMPVTFGRGCRYRCNFCAHNSFLSARCHSPQYFVEMLDDVSRQCGVSTFIVQDSSVGSFKQQWAEVCRLLIDSGANYRWWANLRVNQADEEFLALMKKAGCIKLFFGFESGSSRILERMNKKITVEQCINVADMCHRLEIPFYSSYIINYFGETEDDLQATEELIMRTRPDSLAINRFSPIPGSVDYDSNEAAISPLLTDIHRWSILGMLAAPLLFGNMPAERFEYWNKRLKQLKYTINSHEGNKG